MKIEIFILIVYLEGDEKTIPKQEENLFLDQESKRIWAKIFALLGFGGFEFRISPKKIKNKRERKNFITILSNFVLRRSNDKLEIKIIITGDHDEKESKHKKVLEARENLANEIKEGLRKNETHILLKRKPNFKIEKFMEAILGGFPKIYKKFLTRTLNNSMPMLKQLFKIKEIDDSETIANFVFEQIKKSKHIVLNKIWEISPINKLQLK